MSIPRFLLTRTVPLTIYRQEAGSYVRGVWVEGSIVEVPIRANIQPLKPSEVQMMPESDRTREWYRLWTTDLVRTKQEGAQGYDADEFIWKGYRYQIMKAQSWDMGVLDHHEAWAARISVTPD